MNMIINDSKTKLFLEILPHIDRKEIREWANQVNTPYYFLNFNPNTKQIVACRWGKASRPARSDANLWQRLRVQQFSLDKDIWAALELWTRLWKDIHFNVYLSEPLPTPYPNTIFSTPKASKLSYLHV